MFENAQLRVLDVNISAGDSTFDHRHSNDLISVCVSSSDTRSRTPTTDWGAVGSRRELGHTNLTEYAGQPGTHAVQNVGSNLYRLIAVENLKQGEWSTDPAATGPGITVLNDARAFRAYSIQFQPGTHDINRRHTVPSVVVLAAGGITINRRGIQPQRLDASTRWAVIPAGESYTLTAQGTDQIRIVEIEIR